MLSISLFIYIYTIVTYILYLPITISILSVHIRTHVNFRHYAKSFIYIRFYAILQHPGKTFYIMLCHYVNYNFEFFFLRLLKGKWTSFYVILCPKFDFLQRHITKHNTKSNFLYVTQHFKDESDELLYAKQNGLNKCLI